MALSAFYDSQGWRVPEWMLTVQTIIKYVKLIATAIDRCIQDVVTLSEKFVGLALRVGLLYGLYKLVAGGLLEQFIGNL